MALIMRAENVRRYVYVKFKTKIQKYATCAKKCPRYYVPAKSLGRWREIVIENKQTLGDHVSHACPTSKLYVVGRAMQIFCISGSFRLPDAVRRCRSRVPKMEHGIGRLHSVNSGGQPRPGRKCMVDPMCGFVN